MNASGHIYVRTRKREDQWYVRYRVGERRFNRRLGPAWKEKGRPPDGYFTKRKAQAELHAILTDARRGNLPESVTTQHTYAEAVAEWLRYVEAEGRSPGTVRDYRRAARRHLEPEFAGPVGAITTAQIDRFRDRLLADGKLSKRTVQKLLAMNYSVLKRAMRLGWIASNPAENAERVRVKRSGAFNVLAPEEVAGVARKAADPPRKPDDDRGVPKWMAEQDAVLITVAAFTGLRMGELRALRWGDVDFANHNLFVRQNRVRGRTTQPKSGKVRSVPLIDQAARALDKLSRRENFTEPSDLVFISTTGSYIDDYKLRRRFYDALDRAGLGHKREEDPPLRFHDLRHTFGTLGAQVWPLRDLQAYMGHAGIKTTEGYAHHVPKHDAADALTRLVESASATIRATRRFAGVMEECG